MLERPELVQGEGHGRDENHGDDLRWYLADADVCEHLQQKEVDRQANERDGEETDALACKCRCGPEGPQPVEHVVVEDGDKKRAGRGCGGRQVERPKAGAEDEEIDDEPHASDCTEAQKLPTDP